MSLLSFASFIGGIPAACVGLFQARRLFKAWAAKDPKRKSILTTSLVSLGSIAACCLIGAIIEKARGFVFFPPPTPDTQAIRSIPAQPNSADSSKNAPLLAPQNTSNANQQGAGIAITQTGDKNNAVANQVADCIQNNQNSEDNHSVMNCLQKDPELTKKQIQQIENEQRAYIGDIRLSGQMVPGRPYKIDFAVSNRGKTPAKQVNFRSAIDTPLTGNDVDFAKVPAPYSLAELAPGESIQPQPTLIANAAKIGDPGKPINEATYDAVRSGRITLYVIGRTEYKDIFDKPHGLTFCYLLNPDASSYSHCNFANSSDSVYGMRLTSTSYGRKPKAPSAYLSMLHRF